MYFCSKVAALIDNIPVQHLKIPLSLPHAIQLIPITFMAPATKRRDITIDFFLRTEFKNLLNVRKSVLKLEKIFWKSDYAQL